MIKILFVDCDGVVNNIRTPNTDGWPIDPFCAFLIGKIVLATDCKIVLSSSWRHSAEGRGVFRRKVYPFIDITDHRNYATRGDEIASWLLANPDVTRYAILDDDADMLPEQLPSFFQTTFAEGLTEEIAERVIKYLCAT
ncbi:MAG: HAD domain-containing protein [Candidatus Marinimicrobia bacterium]|nr:HAD domain-containing protein [Candidatus Neomarinimicrobiota bacterium]